MLNMLQLETFAEVVEYRHFACADAPLNISRGAASRRVTVLEECLGALRISCSRRSVGDWFSTIVFEARSRSSSGRRFGKRCTLDGRFMRRSALSKIYRSASWVCNRHATHAGLRCIKYQLLTLKALKNLIRMSCARPNILYWPCSATLVMLKYSLNDAGI
ncbi:LysR family transcriptional regulator [Paraburkholderia caffeinilytica]|uniref:LysR family transcriptional regulator n=2 Tax=Paraburkholderia caffeinilytica TaxID=1761016 RepID=UPI00346499F2